ncbi:mucolipin-3-like isoform X3 [Convolutriloba macropyga]|uniref:mucolipin-3-like isoform X3 n=1 Tax=Convolutriloba macropyga TaxID=536237 RepID=UPI003F522E47
MSSLNRRDDHIYVTISDAAETPELLQTTQNGLKDVETSDQKRERSTSDLGSASYEPQSSSSSTAAGLNRVSESANSDWPNREFAQNSINCSANNSFKKRRQENFNQSHSSDSPGEDTRLLLSSADLHSRRVRKSTEVDHRAESQYGFHSMSESRSVDSDSELLIPHNYVSFRGLIHNLTLDDRMIELTKQKLYYHFQNPCWKFRVKGTKPIKMMVQVIKIIFVTLQLSLFSKYQFDFRLFIDGNFQTFDHLFLLNWEADYGDPVQRVPDPYAVYHIDDFYASVNFTVTSYFTLTYKALGNFSYPVNYHGELGNGKRKHRGGSALGPAANLPNDEIPPIIFKLTFYEVEPDPDQPYHMKLEGDPVDKYYYVYYSDTVNGEFDMVTWEGQKDNDFSLNWSSLLSFEIKFSLINQHIGSSRTYFKPVCYLFNISITYDNSRHTGKLPINSKYTDSTTDCVSITYESSDDGVSYMVLMTIMDCCITALAVFSFVLCVRSVQHNWYLRRVTKAIWLKKFNKPLGKKDEAKFVQFWYFIIIVGDCCLIAGSLLKIFVTFRVTQVYTVCAVLLGCATMIVWIGVLKYLNYFHTYNALLLTLKYSMPNVLRFLFCCLFIYFGFALAGWAVFGPFHYKFRTFVATMETMYSLINGDDMFETFAQMRRVSTLVYVFNQIWLYVFIGLFIYCVLSLFIGIITETYEQIRNSREKGGHPELTEMEQFFLEAVRDKDLIESIKKMKHSRAFICICCMPDGFDDLAAVHVASNINNDNNNTSA